MLDFKRLSCSSIQKDSAKNSENIKTSNQELEIQLRCSKGYEFNSTLQLILKVDQKDSQD